MPVDELAARWAASVAALQGMEAAASDEIQSDVATVATTVEDLQPALAAVGYDPTKVAAGRAQAVPDRGRQRGVEPRDRVRHPSLRGAERLVDSNPSGSARPRRGATLEVEIGIGKSGRRAYGFDDIAIVPSRRTRDPEDVDITWELDAFNFELPLIAAAMDGVVSPATAIEVGRLGGLGCLNLEGLWTRYDDLEPVFRRSRRSSPRRPRAACRRSTRSRSRKS